MEIEPGYNFNRNFAQWVENEDEDGDGEDDHFIFGELESRVFEIGVRGTYAFTPNLSLQLFVQPFVTTGDYGAIKELARPRSYEFSPYAGLEENPDFHHRSLRSNVVLRWELPARQHALRGLAAEPGSRAFNDVSDPRFRPAGDLSRAFTDDGDSIFLIKLNRWFGAVGSVRLDGIRIRWVSFYLPLLNEGSGLKHDDPSEQPRIQNNNNPLVPLRVF